MNKSDWSLVFFTTLAQTSVGIIVVATIVMVSASAGGHHFHLELIPGNPVLPALLMMGVATLVSFLHLGSPLNAPYSLNNLSGSWLSREILAINLYLLSLLLTLVLDGRTGSFDSTRYLLLLSSILGLALLWMMMRIYLMPTIPAWNSWYTPVSFFSTATGLGILCVLGLSSLMKMHFSGPILNKLTMVLTIVIMIEWVSCILNQARIQKLQTGIRRPVYDRGPYYRTFLTRMTLLSLILLGLIILQLPTGLVSTNNSYIFGGLIFLLTVAQEVLGRQMFYASYFRLGV